MRIRPPFKSTIKTLKENEQLENDCNIFVNIIKKLMKRLVENAYKSGTFIVLSDYENTNDKSQTEQFQKRINELLTKEKIILKFEDTDKSSLSYHFPYDYYNKKDFAWTFEIKLICEEGKLKMNRR